MILKAGGTTLNVRTTFSKVLATALALLFAATASLIPASAANSAYESQLISKGFPEAYAKKLATVHNDHPNWDFIPVVNGLAWDTVVDNEYAGHRNTVYISPNNGSATRLYCDQSSGTYAEKNGFPFSYVVRDGSNVNSDGWIDASKMAVAYYMNPYNFIGSDVTILQFASLEWNFPDNQKGNKAAYDAICGVLENTFMSVKRNSYNTKYVDNNGNIIYTDPSGKKQTLDYTYPMVICAAAKTYNMDPAYLAAKIIGEVGSAGSGSVSGTYSGYTGYYNFLNVGAYDSSAGESVANGLTFAKKKGWNNPIASIYGGAEIVANDYLKKGQNTCYYQKFNVTKNNTYNHQYMTAINGAINTTYMTYTGYKRAGILNNARKFYIPVYNSIPSPVGKEVHFKGYSDYSGYGNGASGVVTTAATIRSTPSISGSKVGTVSNGTKVNIMGGYRDTKVTYDPNYRINATEYRMFRPLWYHVRTADGTIGYIQEDYVANQNTKSLKSGGSFKLNFIGNGNEKPRFMSLDTRVATVDSNGTVTARSTGATRVVVYLTNGAFDVITVSVNGASYDNAAPGTASKSQIGSSSNNGPTSGTSQENGRPQRGGNSGLVGAIRDTFGSLFNRDRNVG